MAPGILGKKIGMTQIFNAAGRVVPVTALRAGPCVVLQRKTAAKDGYDAVEWAAAQPWSNGKVGMIGGSYVGLTQWQAAIEQPPHLVAIAPHYSSSDYHDGWTYQGGALDLWFALSWTSQVLASDTLQRRLEASGMSMDQVREEVTTFATQADDKLFDDWLWRVPLTDFPAFRRNGNLAPYFDEWLAPDTPEERRLALARSAYEGPFSCWPVSRRVNNARNDDPELLLPLNE